MAGLLLVNPHSGDGRLGADELAAAARERGMKTRVLGPGEAYYFASQLPHRFRNVGRETCEIISANTPPSF